MPLRYTLALPFTLLPAIATADVTPQDVWDNMVATYGAIGMNVDSNPITSGANLVINDAVLRVIYPVIGGELTATMPTFDLVDMGDGRVQVMMPDTYVMDIVADIPDSTEKMSASLAIAQQGLTMIASGVRGDITYDTDVASFDMLLSNAIVPGNDFDLVFEFESDGYVASSRVTEGQNLTLQTDVTTRPAETKFTFTAGPLTQNSATTSGAITSTAVVVLPPNLDVLDLTPSLLAGLSISILAQSDGSQTKTVTAINGEMQSEQIQQNGDGETQILIDNDGFTLGGNISGVALSYTDKSMLPFPINAATGAVNASFAFPLIAREAPQDFRYAFAITDLSIDSDLWGTFDPKGALDRSPADVAIDLSGTVGWGINLLNFEELGALEYADTIPITAETVSVNAFGLNALGAAINAVGAVSFDNDDMTTFPGMPRPDGTVEVTATGLNAAMEQLTAAGLLPEEQIGMARMMMGMFARVTGDDTLETTVETNTQGHVIVNGQRMR